MTVDRVCGCAHLQTQHHGRCAECLCPMWHPDMLTVPATINCKWTVNLPEYRAYRPSWAWHEAGRLAAMRSVIQTGDVVYEIGAEEGDYAALFCSWGAKVVIAEPNPFCWPSIRASMEANRCRPEAWWLGFVSDHRWKIESDPVDRRFGFDGSWPDEADGTLIPEHGFQHLAEHGAVTPALTFQDLVRQARVAPDVVSIDVEGGEFHVLRGFGTVLEDRRPVVFLSIHPQFLADLYSLDAADVHSLMADHGYTGTHLATDHEEHWIFCHPEGRQPW